MVFISPDCTGEGLVAGLLGGIAIGFTVVGRAASLGERLPSSTYDLSGTNSMMLTSLVLAASLGGKFFEVRESADGLLYFRLAAAGTLVGAGSSLGKGCTSGNGIQGLAALSPFSLVFVCAFMAAAAVAAPLFRSSADVLNDDVETVDRVPWELFLVAVAFAGAQYIAGKESARLAALEVDALHAKGGVIGDEQAAAAAEGGLARATASLDLVALFARVAAALGGVAFALALVVSAMAKPSKVLGFLDFTNEDRGWDPTLAFVMGGGLLVAAPAYHILGLRDKAPCGPHARRTGGGGGYMSTSEWARRPIDRNAVLGGLLFGLGWGMAGLCPGPGIVMCGAALAPPQGGGGFGFVMSSLFASGGVWALCMFGTKHGVDRLMQSRQRPCQISPGDTGALCPHSTPPETEKKNEVTKVVVQPATESPLYGAVP